ncbi:hypothetical protein BH18ACI3_BH18ACI3_09650 [soil metagenome]
MKLLYLFLCPLLFVPATLSQSIKIIPKKITYKRPAPITDFKKTFTVTFPKVKAFSTALSRKIENTISYERVLGLNINEEINDVQWLEDAAYEVGYNKTGLLSISISIHGAGAYPFGTEKALVVDLKTGNRIKPSDVFVSINKLTALVLNAQKMETMRTIAEIRNHPEDRDIDPEQLFLKIDFRLSDLQEFAISNEGITFIYDYDFPYVVKAFQPEGRYFFTWNQLKPFIKRSGLLARFVR